MTHSLHRRGDFESLKEDFVVLGCPATGVNKAGSAPKTQNLPKHLLQARADQFGRYENGKYLQYHYGRYPESSL